MYYLTKKAITNLTMCIVIVRKACANYFGVYRKEKRRNEKYIRIIFMRKGKMAKNFKGKLEYSSIAEKSGIMLY